MSFSRSAQVQAQAAQRLRDDRPGVSAMSSSRSPASACMASRSALRSASERNLVTGDFNPSRLTWK